MQGAVRHKPHLLFTWLNELIRHPRILDAVEDVIGPDILCWGTSFFIKERRNPGYVSWHQDFDLLGAGAARHHHRLGGVHRQHRGERRDAGDPRHRISWTRCRTATPSPPRTCCRAARRSWWMSMSAQAAMLELAAGEMSLHHVRLIHGSDPNPSDDRRIGFAIRYIPTYVRQVAGSHDSATLVRGEDRHHHFEHRAAAGRRHVAGGGCLPRGGHRRARADPDARDRAGDAGVGTQKNRWSLPFRLGPLRAPSQRAAATSSSPRSAR